MPDPARQALERIAAAGRAIAAAQAERLEALAAFAGLRPPPAGEPRRFEEFAPEEIAAATAVAPAVAARELTFACGVTDRLPESLAAFRSGEIDLVRLQAMERVTAPLSTEDAGKVERRILAKGCRPSQDAFTAAIRRAVIAVDPDGQQRRHGRRRQERHVRMRPKDDGMSELSALLRAQDALACHHRLDVMAALAGGGDDRRTHAQIRADVLTDLLLGRDKGDQTVAVEVQVVVPVTTLLGTTETPGELPGYGPIPAVVARELSSGRNSTWRRILTDPVSGSLVEVADRRHPSPKQVRHVRARDRTCRFPGCHRPARHTDIDHTLEFSVNGRTIRVNLGAVCRRHHRMKHAGRGWRLEQTSDGSFTWTSPTGQTYDVRAEPYSDFLEKPGADPAGAPLGASRSEAEGAPSLEPAAPPAPDRLP